MVKKGLPEGTLSQALKAVKEGAVQRSGESPGRGLPVQPACSAPATEQRPMAGGQEGARLGMGGGEGRVVQGLTGWVRTPASTLSEVGAIESSGQSRNMT